MQNKFWNN